MEETIILNFEVDQTQAQKQLVQTEKNIRALKKEQADLNKEYKAGKITEDQYVESNIKLQRALKAEAQQKNSLNKLLDAESNSRNAVKARVSQLAKEYDNLNTKTDAGAKRQKELADELKNLNAQISKTSDNAGLFKDQIGNYPKAFADAASQIKVAGVSVGDFAGKATALLNPATAAAGVIGLLGSAFLSTRDGAELLESAQFKLQSGFQILGRETAKLVQNFTDLISSDSGLGGFTKEMLLAFPPVQALIGSLKLLDTVTGGYVSGLVEETEALAAAKAAYDDLLRSQIEESEQIAELERQISVLTTKREEETTTELERVAIDKQILGFEKERFEILVANAKLRKSFLEEEAQRLGGVNKLTDEQLQLLISVRNEVKNLEGEYAQRTKKILSDVDSINDKLREQAKLQEEIRKADSQDERAQRRAVSGVDAFEFGQNDNTETEEEKAQAAKTEALIEGGQMQINAQKSINDSLLKFNKQYYEKDLAFKKESARLKQQVDEAQLASAATIAGAAASLFDQQSAEYKIFATAQTLISTYSTAQKAYEAAFTPPTVASPILAGTYVAAAIATGLANVAAINGIGFADGGWTGAGDRNQVAGVVHADEYVIPKHIVNSPAAAPHISAVENMRVRGYADGGFVTNQNTASTQQAMITANALKNMPPAFVSWTEGEKVGRRVRFRERTSRI